MTTIFVVGSSELDLKFLRREILCSGLCSDMALDKDAALLMLKSFPHTFSLLLIDADHPKAIEIARDLRLTNKEIEIVFWGEPKGDITGLTEHQPIPKQRVPYTINSRLVRILAEKQEAREKLSMLESRQPLASTPKARLPH